MNIYRFLYQRFQDTNGIADIIILYDLKNGYCSSLTIRLNKNKYYIDNNSQEYPHNYNDRSYKSIEDANNDDKLDLIRFILSFN